MPYDGRNFRDPLATSFDDFVTSLPGYRFNTDSTRPTTQNSPLFGLDGAEWRGFFLALTGVLALVLGVSAIVLSLAGG